MWPGMYAQYLPIIVTVHICQARGVRNMDHNLGLHEEVKRMCKIALNCQRLAET